MGSNPGPRLFNPDLSQSNLDPRLSNPDLSQSKLDPRLSHNDLSQSKLDPRQLQQGPSLLLSSSSGSSPSPSQVEDRGQLPSQPSLAEHPEPGLSRDLSWEFPHSSRASSLSLPSLTAGSSPDLRASLSSDRLRFSPQLRPAQAQPGQLRPPQAGS